MTAEIEVLNVTFALHRLKTTDLIPPTVFHTRFYWIGRTDNSLSLICDRNLEIGTSPASEDWHCLKLRSLDISDLATMTRILRDSKVEFIPLPSSSGAYGLVRHEQMSHARRVLTASGYQLAESGETEPSLP